MLKFQSSSTKAKGSEMDELANTICSNVMAWTATINQVSVKAVRNKRDSLCLQYR